MPIPLQVLDFIILPQILSILTFPGIILREFWHKLLCERAGVVVHEVCYFQLGAQTGYVKHDTPKTYNQSFIIIAGPYLIGTVLAVFLFLLARLLTGNILYGVLIWLGSSSAMNCFPSYPDADTLWTETFRHRSLLARINLPIALIIKLSSLLRTVWFGLAYVALLWQVAIRL